MENKQDFFFALQCLCLINDSFGEKCDQGRARSIYFKQPLTHPGAGLKTCGCLLSSPLNCTLLSNAADYLPMNMCL